MMRSVVKCIILTDRVHPTLIVSDLNFSDKTSLMLNLPSRALSLSVTNYKAPHLIFLAFQC